METTETKAAQAGFVKAAQKDFKRLTDARKWADITWQELTGEKHRAGQPYDSAEVRLRIRARADGSFSVVRKNRTKPAGNKAREKAI